ncbi:hypothetical protein EYF80_015718 [Liparis tanakae]|uniref:Secreted protein n=1 Tax=Liparis tanakae TaxID=230148 RepID=A0A4Z2I7P6_9TELE|nr:hypothetical protein EYF80_015718 [Liparis tanakae]
MIWKRGGAQLRDPLILVLSLISSARLPLLTATSPVPGNWQRESEQNGNINSDIAFGTQKDSLKAKVSCRGSLALPHRGPLAALRPSSCPRGGMSSAELASLRVHTLQRERCRRVSVLDVHRSELRVHLTPSSTSSVKSTTMK